MPDEKYTIDDLFQSEVSQSFGVPTFFSGVPDFENVFNDSSASRLQNLSISGDPLSSGTVKNNIFIGFYSGKSNTTGYNNSSIGAFAMRYNTTGRDNVAVGQQALTLMTTGNLNTAIGNSALAGLLTGQNNTAIGTNSLFSARGSDNTAIGVSALTLTGTGSRNIAIGYLAGYYETGSDAFYVNNQDRTNTAGDKTKSILYGVMAAAAADQKLTINGLLNQSVSKTPASATATGTTGDIAWDANYIYVCTSTDAWKRTAIATW